MVNSALRISLITLAIYVGPASWCNHGSQLSGMLARDVDSSRIPSSSPLRRTDEAPRSASATAEDGVPIKAMKTVYDFTVKDIHGADVALKDYEGKVIVVVNVASKCGYTPQYEALQALYEEQKDAGLVILGFPCNQFGGQEPGTHEEIEEFCKLNYGVKFDLFSKIDVNGEDRAPLYEFLTKQTTKPKGAGDVQWNFEKFIIDRTGGVAARFGTKIKPESMEFKTAVLELLKQPKNK